jgi:hypothetical protein
MENDHVGNQGGIDDQFAHPEAFGLLFAQQKSLGAPEGGPPAVVKIIICPGRRV